MSFTWVSDHKPAQLTDVPRPFSHLVTWWHRRHERRKP